MKKPALLLIPVFGLSLFFNSAAAPNVNVGPLTPAQNPRNVFTRMFPGLPSFAQQTDSARYTMQLMGARYGILDAQDDLTDPIQSITNPAVFSPRNPDNPNMTAGITFLGQFLDHDLTLDRDSPLNEIAYPEQTENLRTGAFDLDSVYGDGPGGTPALYKTDKDGRIKFMVEAIPGSETVSRNGTVRNDLPRDAQGNALIADGRNDENVIISQLHLAILLFHNAVTDYVAAQPAYRDASAEAVFAEARRLVTWHYQWIILHEFLPTTIGQDRVDRILENGLKYYRPDDPANHAYADDGQRIALIPVEFAVAAYRFGHSQARPSYRLNFGPTGGAPFFALLFDDTQDPNATDPNDLRGGKRAPRRFVDWQTFFDFGDGNVRFNKRIDTKLSSVLMSLPGASVPAPGLPLDGVQALPARTLMRHINFGLPSGQAMARKMHLPVLTPMQLAELAPYALDSRYTMDTSSPLFFYILKEAEVMEDGLRLGPLGARIVGEVFVGVLKADAFSYLHQQPDWRPSLPSAQPESFRMTDLLNFAGVVPAL